MTHAHYPDRAQELASRTEVWQPHFERRIQFGKRHHANIVIYGHLHIPMILEREGVLLVNPGAIASGNPWTRQIIQTVAVMVLEDGQSVQVTHYDVNTKEVHQPIFDASGFTATANHYSEIILKDDLYAVLDCILRVAHLRWSGQRGDSISVQELVTAFQSASLPPETNRLLREHPLFAPCIE